MYVPKIMIKIFQEIVLIAHYTPLKQGLKKQAGHPQVPLPNTKFPIVLTSRTESTHVCMDTHPSPSPDN